MFTGVLLHMIEPPLPVEPSRYRTLAGIAGDCMEDFTIPCLDAEHLCVIQRAGVAGLTAAFRVKRGAVEEEGVLPAWKRRLLEDRCCKLPQIRVVII